MGEAAATMLCFSSAKSERAKMQRVPGEGKADTSATDRQTDTSTTTLVPSSEQPLLPTQLRCAFLRTASIRQLFSCCPRAAGVSYLSAAVRANPKKRPASTMLTALLGAGLGLTGKPQAQAVQGGPMPEVSTAPARPSSTAPPPTQPHQINHRHDSCPAGKGERSPAARCPPEGRWLQTLPQGEVQR